MLLDHKNEQYTLVPDEGHGCRGCAFHDDEGYCSREALYDTRCITNDGIWKLLKEKKPKKLKRKAKRKLLQRVVDAFNGHRLSWSPNNKEGVLQLLADIQAELGPKSGSH